MLRTSPLALLLSALSASLTACAGSPGRTVVGVAQHDLQCENVEVNKISNNRFGAYGCGRGAVYAQICEQGKSCTWGRLRHGHESAISMKDSAAAQAAQPTPPRQVLAAPPPPSREVHPAPAPGAPEAIPAPPPGSSGGEAADAAVAPAADANVEQGGTAPAPPADPQAPVPLSQGALSEPYQTQVPVQEYTQRSEQPPPVPLAETRPPMPAPNYIWVSGYWWWNSPTWVWAPGYWCPPRVGFTYMPGSWYWSAGYWWYGPGGWAYPGSRVIVHRVDPRPTTYATVRSFTPHRVVAGPTTPRASAGLASTSPRAGDTGFRPSSSPLHRYPSSSGVAPRASVSGRPGSIGRVVTPGASVPRISAPNARGTVSSNSYRSSSFHNAPPRISQPRGLSSGSMNYSTPRASSPSYSAPRMSSPSYSAPRMSSPSSFSAPRMSSPRMSSPRMSSPRMSAPSHSAPRMSAPRMSAPRGGGGRR